MASPARPQNLDPIHRSNPGRISFSDEVRRGHENDALHPQNSTNSSPTGSPREESSLLNPRGSNSATSRQALFVPYTDDNDGSDDGSAPRRRVSWHTAMSVSPGGGGAQRRGSPLRYGTTTAPTGEEQQQQGGESSADENTAIVERIQRRDYGAASAGVGQPVLGDGTDERARAGGTSTSTNGQGIVRRRKQRREDAGEREQVGTEGESWWKRMVEKYGSVELENKGAVARDHLALERTFLAWLRTSLSFASIGIAVTQLFRLNTTFSDGSSSSPSLSLAASHLRQVGKPLGATFLAVAILVLGVGFHRYFESQHYVIRGKFPASRGSVMLISFVAMALIIASLVVVVAVAPAAFEKR